MARRPTTGVRQKRLNERWIQTESDKIAVKKHGCWFDIEAAQRTLYFFERFLRHSKGRWAGKPFSPLPWQRDQVIAPLFGWKREDNTRRFRRAMIGIPKKNGKSTLCGGVAAYMGLGDGEHGAEVLCAGTDKVQAGIVWNEAASMVLASPALISTATVIRSQQRILDTHTNSIIRTIAADAARQEGLNPNCVVFDEFHVQKSAELYDTLRYASITRVQPMFIIITTAGASRHSLCHQEWKRAIAVRDGAIDDIGQFTFIAAAEDNDDWSDEEVWKKCNPSLGSTFSIESMREDFKVASETPAKENVFRRYRLNQWTAQEERWLSIGEWRACSGGEIVLPEDLLERLRGRRCYGGLDLSATRDITALCLWFPDDAGGGDFFWKFWVPQDSAAKRSKQDNVLYLDWIGQGWIDACPGKTIDYSQVRAEINRIREIVDVIDVGTDPYNAIKLGKELQEDGCQIVLFRQGFGTLSAPSKELDARHIAHTMRHWGNPVADWMAGNVAIDRNPNGDIRPNKAKSSERIDGIVAAIMALGRAAESEGPTSPYNDRPLLVLG